MRVYLDQAWVGILVSIRPCSILRICFQLHLIVPLLLVLQVLHLFLALLRKQSFPLISPRLMQRRRAACAIDLKEKRRKQSQEKKTEKKKRKTYRRVVGLRTKPGFQLQTAGRREHVVPELGTAVIPVGVDYPRELPRHTDVVQANRSVAVLSDFPLAKPFCARRASTSLLAGSVVHRAWFSCSLVLAQRKMLDWEGELLGPWPSLFYHGQLALPRL